MRHADAGYEDAIATARRRKIDLPMITTTATGRRR
jgi:urocanate hydratase